MAEDSAVANVVVASSRRMDSPDNGTLALRQWVERCKECLSLRGVGGEGALRMDHALRRLEATTTSTSGSCERTMGPFVVVASSRRNGFAR